MSVQQSVAARNARIDAVVAQFGSTPVLKIYSGSAPANCAAADTGSVVATLNLPNPCMNAASGGAATKTGTWEDASADGSGTATHFRIFNGATCHLQGTVGTSGADLNLDTVGITAGDDIVITSFTLTAGNA